MTTLKSIIATEENRIVCSSASAPAVTVSTAYVERMASVASQTSGVKARELARAAEHYDIICPIFSVPASLAPVESVQLWRSDHAATPCKTWRPDAVCTGLSKVQ